MTLAKDLLAQAKTLADLDSGKPKQANLRRAISSAYYCLFHLLIDEGAAIVGSKLSAASKAKIRRAFAHADMKTVCLNYAKATSAASFNQQISPLLSFPLAPELMNVAEAFVLLQEARHQADYDVYVVYNRPDTKSDIGLAEAAFADWATIRSTDNAKVFLVDLLLRKGWSRV